MLFPQEYCRDVIQAAIQQYPTAFGFIIEGYPRNISQAQELEKVPLNDEL